MPSSHAFNQVKGILGKLDRSIDEARERRLGNGSDAKPETSALPARSDSNQPAQQTQANESEGAKRYGRAKPIRPSGDVGFRF